MSLRVGHLKLNFVVLAILSCSAAWGVWADTFLDNLCAQFNVFCKLLINKTSKRN